MEKYVQQLYDSLCDTVLQYNPYCDISRLEKAFLFAYEAHKRVYRRSKKLYITHSLNTALNLTRIEADETSIISAILHDVFDNKSITYEAVERQFGAEVAKIVDGTRKLGELYYTLDMTQQEVNVLKNALMGVGDDIRIFLVKIADRLHNLETLEYLPKEKRYRIARETQEIYIPIVNFLSIGEFLTPLNELCFQYTHEDEYKKLQKIFGKKYEYHKSQIIEANNTIEKSLKKAQIDIVKIEGRVKSLYSIYKKIQNKHLDYNDVYDVLALRIITRSVDDVYRVVGQLHHIYNVKHKRFKDYISTPKKNGYQSIHTTVVDENGNYLEFQIQTESMYQLNRSGIAAHYIYKGFGGEYQKLPEWMKGVLNLQQKSIDSKPFFEKLSGEIIISEIKCYNTSGEEMYLPKNATLIDYAFSYDISLGMHFLGAYVNGVYIDDPFHILKNGDFIQLHKQKNIYINYTIRNFFLIKTQIARTHIKGLFKKYSKVKSQELGQHLLNSSLENLGLRHFASYPYQIRQKVIKSFGLKDEAQLYLFIAIEGVEFDDVISKVLEFTQTHHIDKKVILKLTLKSQDSLTIGDLTKLLYDFNVIIEEISYQQKKHRIIVGFLIDGDKNLNNLLKELQRLPNMRRVRRIFPLRLKIYYVVYGISLLLIASVIFSLKYLPIPRDEKTLILDFILYGSVILMLGVIFFLRFFMANYLPDILQYKRFWLSLLILNTFVFAIIWWEILYLGLGIGYVWIFLFSFIVYLLIVYDFLIRTKNKK